jgi:DNA-binding NarL/FixJ family response regulator
MKTPLRILIVEDQPTTVMAIKESLEQTGYTICGDAADYASAVALMKRESPDLVIVDIALKGNRDGIVTAQELIRIKPIPLLYLTIHTDDITFERAKQTNPVAFLYKPFRVREVAMQIDLALLNNHQARDAYERPKAAQVSTFNDLYLPDSYEKDLGNGKKRVQSTFRVRIESIIWLQAHGSYAELFLTQEEMGRLKKNANSLVITMNLGSVLDSLPGHFYRVTTSLVINLNRVDRIEASQVIMEDYPKEIEIPKGGRQQLLAHLNVARSRQRR